MSASGAHERAGRRRGGFWRRTCAMLIKEFIQLGATASRSP